MGQTLQEIVAQLTGIDDIFFFKLAENKGFCEELLQGILENKKLNNPKFPQLCEAFKNIKTGMENGTMCDLVQAYAEEYAKEYAKEYADKQVKKERIKMLVELFNDGMLSESTAAKKLEVIEEQFLEYVDQYQRQKY